MSDREDYVEYDEAVLLPHALALAIHVALMLALAFLGLAVVVCLGLVAF